MASSEVFEVVLSGGAPWGFRLQGGKEFRAPLRIAKVTPSSKADKAGITEGWLVRSINNVNCEDWTHSDALNSIKKAGTQLKLILSSRKPNAPSPEPFSSYTTDDINRGGSTHVSRATFKPSTDEAPSYATMPRGGERVDSDLKRWRGVEENNNENAFTSHKDEHLASDSNEWNPDIISGVVRPPEPIKLVHNLEAIRSVSSSSTSSEPGVQVRSPDNSRGFIDKPRPIGRGGRRFDDRGFQTTGANLQLHSGSVGSEDEYNMQLANGDASSSDSAHYITNRPAMQQFKKQKEQAAVEATKEPRPVKSVPPPTQTKPTRQYSEERKLSNSSAGSGVGPHRPSITRGGKWYKEMFRELHSNAGTSSNLSGLLASDVARGSVRDYEGGSQGSLTPPRSASPSLDHQDNDVFTSKGNYVHEEPLRSAYTSEVSSNPEPAWHSSERKPSRPSTGHVPAWYKDMQKGVEVPVQTIEEPESYIVQKSRPQAADMGKERRFVEPVPSVPGGVHVSPSSSHPTYHEPQRSPNSVTVQMEEKNLPPSATSLYESRFQRRQAPARTASEELQVRQQPPSDEEMMRRREEEVRRRREEEEWRRRREEEERRREEEEMLRKEEEERQRREYEAELKRRREEEEAARREAKPQFVARALYSFQGQTAKELPFRKGDIISVRRQVDKNWIDGELNGRRGIFPANYVELRPVEEEDEAAPPPPIQKQLPRVQVVTQQQRSPPVNQQPQVQQIAQRQSPPQAQTKSVSVDGEARVKYTFNAETTRELPCSKGDIIALVRKVDNNWYEGRVGDRKGIVPTSYLEVFREPGVQVVRQTEQIQPVQSTRVEQAPDFRRTEPSYDPRPQESRSPPGAVFAGQAAPSKLTQVKYIEEPEEPYFGASGVVARAVVDEPMRLGHVQGERFRALFSYEPENEDELRLEEGDEVIVLEKCDDGWFVGTSSQTNLFGTFPGNYVERIP